MLDERGRKYTCAAAVVPFLEHDPSVSGYGDTPFESPVTR